MRCLTLTVMLSTIPLSAQSWKADYDQPEAKYQALFNTRVMEGYRLVSANGRKTKRGNRFEVLWIKDSKTRWFAFHGLTSAEYQKKINTLGRAGYRPICVDSYGDYPNERYITAFVKDKVRWSARHGLTGSAYQTAFNQHDKQGYRLMYVGSSGAGNGLRFSGIWVKPGARYAGAHGQTLGTFQNTMKYWKARGGRLVSIATAGAPWLPFFSGAWDFSKTTTIELPAQTLTELLNSTATMSLAGYRPLAVAGYETTSGSRYISSWTRGSSTRSWVERGVAVAGMTSFDRAMQSYMQSNNISRGVLAVTKGSRLTFARGYTWAPASVAPTQPESLFRVASLSKAITAVAVLRLVQSGKLKLDQKLSTILDMKSWTDSRTRNVTIRQLLQHWGGWDRNKSGDPMFNDFAISRALRRPLPTTPQMVIDWMKTRSLDQTPGSGFAYSNFGYSLLGRVIETITGTPFEDFAQREVLLPIGASSTRVTDSLRGQQIPGEVDYDDPTLVASVMGPSSPAKVQRPYGGWNIRTMDSHGGFVSTAIDYARFLVAFDDKTKSPLLSKSLIDEMWKRPPGDNSTNPVYYGMGWQVRELGGGAINTWHTGSLDGTWTIMVRKSGGVNWVAFFNKRTSNSSAIDQLLHSGASGVTAWPSHDLFPTFASLTSYGPGCKGSRGIPYARFQAGSSARLGRSFTIELTRLGITPMNLAFLHLGLSNTRWGTLKLPHSLSYLGMPGCYLNVRPDQHIPLWNSKGQARLELQVPNRAALAGWSFFLQGMQVDRGVNAAGITSTPGAQIRIGR